MSEQTTENRTVEQVNQQKRQQPSLWRDILQLLLKIAGVILIVILLFLFMFGVFRNNDQSMDPAIKEGDLVFFYRLNKQYVATDTVVLEFKGQRQVRRVVAVSGDTVDITEEGLMINGNLQLERDIYEETFQYEEGIRFPLTVGQGEIFVLGDGRERATDSRIYGCVPAKETLGKVITITRRRGI